MAYDENYERELRCRQIEKDLATPLYKRPAIMLSALGALLALVLFALVIVDKTVGLSAREEKSWQR